MGVGSTLYNVFSLLHVLAVVAAFGPAFVLPRLAKAAPEDAAKLHQFLALPALVLMWVFGMGLAGLSDDTWELTQPWIAASLVIWVVLVAVGWFVIRPALLGRAPKERLSMGFGITHLGLVLGLWLMIFKPGL